MKKYFYTIILLMLGISLYASCEDKDVYYGKENNWDKTLEIFIGTSIYSSDIAYTIKKDKDDYIVYTGTSIYSSDIAYTMR